MKKAMWGENLKRICLILILAMTMTGCGLGNNGGSMRSSINADIILLDISGSSLNGVGTYNSEDHSTSSLASRQLQIRNKLSRAISENTAVYFGFVRKSYGEQELMNLLAPKLFLDMKYFIDEDMNNEVRKKDTREGIAEIWQGLITSVTPISGNCSSNVATQLINKSLGKLSMSHANSLGSQLCLSAKNSQDMISQIENIPKDKLGSDIQGAIDRTLEKLSSEERRLFSPEGKPVTLNPRVILVSDLIQKMQSGFLPEALKPLKDKDAACTFATESAASHSLTYQGSPLLISDGFGGTKGKINEAERDKLKEYWVCWLKTRGIFDIDLGARGIDLGNL
jgi:hypothetical protein